MATADLNDVNMIDPYHLSAYGKVAVNYNRDVEIFPVLNALFERLMGTSPYKSPTDMGVNMAGFAISDDKICCDASKQEIIRRFLKAIENERRNNLDPKESEKILLLMNKLNISVHDREVCKACEERQKEVCVPVSAIQFEDGTIITGKTSELLESQSAMLLNALKHLAGIPDEVKLLLPERILPILDLKRTVYNRRNDNTILRVGQVKRGRGRRETTHFKNGTLKMALDPFTGDCTCYFLVEGKIIDSVSGNGLLIK